MKLYDYEKVKSFISENREKIEKVTLGMHEDWFWTANTVYEDGEFVVDLVEGCLIGGIAGSRWATPTANVAFKDGTEEFIEVSKGENTGAGSPIGLGCLSGPVQDAIKPIARAI